jgi:hypothetical protein
MDPLTDHILLSGFLEIHENVVNSGSFPERDFVRYGVETLVRLHSIGIDHDAPLPTMTVELLGQVEGKFNG